MTTTFKLGPQRILILNTNKEFSFFWGGGGLHDTRSSVENKKEEGESDSSTRVTNINSLLTISTHHQKERLRESIK